MKQAIIPVLSRNTSGNFHNFQGLKYFPLLFTAFKSEGGRETVTFQKVQESLVKLRQGIITDSKNILQAYYAAS